MKQKLRSALSLSLPLFFSSSPFLFHRKCAGLTVQESFLRIFSFNKIPFSWPSQRSKKSRCSGHVIDDLWKSRKHARPHLTEIKDIFDRSKATEFMKHLNKCSRDPWTQSTQRLWHDILKRHKWWTRSAMVCLQPLIRLNHYCMHPFDGRISTRLSQSKSFLDIHQCFTSPVARKWGLIFQFGYLPFVAFVLE